LIVDQRITHNPPARRFGAIIDNHVAELTYRIDGDRMLFTHTGVPHELQGRGIGGALVKAGLDYAAENKLRVVPMCSFVAAYINRHPEYQKLVEPGE
jgi:predicted GNAT family acetyltransferase